jgi:hypothetical protein
MVELVRLWRIQPMQARSPALGGIEAKEVVKVMAIQILLPFNFTLQDEKALDFVIRMFSRVPDKEVTLYNAYTPPPVVDTTPGTVMKNMQANIRALQQRNQEKEARLRGKVEALVEAGFDRDRIQTVYQPRKRDVASDIVEVARARKCEVVVLNRKPGKVSRFFTASTHTRVIAAMDNTTVCVVS